MYDIVILVSEIICKVINLEYAPKISCKKDFFLGLLLEFDSISRK